MIYPKLLLLWSCLVFPCLAQDAPPAAADLAAPIFSRFQHMGPEAGLTQVRISSLLQDRMGFLWIGTLDGGLVRYDGYTFRSFKHDPGDSTSLSSSAVETVFEDSRGWLWVGTSEGLNRFHPETETFSRFDLSPAPLGEPLRVTSICEDSTAGIWVGTLSGLFHIPNPDELAPIGSSPMLSVNTYQAPKTQLLPDESHLESLKNRINSLLVDEQGVIWVGTEGGLGWLSELPVPALPNHPARVSYTFNSFSEDPGAPNYLPNQYVVGLISDRNGGIWVLMDDLLYRIDGSNGLWAVESYTLPWNSNHQSALFAVPDVQPTRVWIGAGGIRSFDPISKSHDWIRITTEDAGAVGVAPSVIIQGETGVVWVGTDWHGLYKYDPTLQFSAYSPELNQLRSNQVNMRFVFEDSRQNLWIAVKTLYRCDRVSGEMNLIPGPRDNEGVLVHINCACEDSKQNVWFGTEKQGLFRYNPDRDVLEKTVEIGRNPVVNATAIAEDRDGNIWVPLLDYNPNDPGGGTDILLCKINPTNMEVKTYYYDSWTGDYGARLNYYFYDIQNGQPGVFWLAAGYGLLRFEEEQASFKLYKHDPKNKHSLSNNLVKAICPDPRLPERYLWLGTQEGGLNRFDVEEETFRHYTMSEGLPSNHISSILSDKKGHLWLATDNGISKITLNRESREVESIRTYNRGDGLHANDFTFFYGQNAAKTASGELIFAGPKGFNIFHPDNIKPNLNAPPVLISDLQINYEPVGIGGADSPLQKQIALTKEIKLPYDRNTLRFEMTALDFRVPEKNRYAYKMEGYDQNWIDNGMERTAHYTGLPWGKYVFRVRAANSDGAWNEEGTALKITITPPWWRTSWAYFLYGLFFFGLLYGLRRYEKNRQRLKYAKELGDIQAEKLREVDRMKSQFFANISHEFRTPLTLILGPAEELISVVSENKAKQKLGLIHRNAKRLLQLINQMLDLSKLETGKMQLQTRPGDFIASLKGLVMSFESWARGKRVELRFVFEPCEGFEPLQGLYFDGDKIEKIFTNLLSNALKFTSEGGRVEVTATLIADCRWGLSHSGPGQKYEIRHPKCEVCINSQNASNDQGAPPSVNCVEIRVTDTGVGIPADRLPHIFDRFYQVDASSTREHEGTGIGLALVKELVQVHNGSIEVESEEGRGTTFTVCLPLGKEHLQVDEIVDTPLIPPQGGTEGGVPSRGELKGDVEANGYSPKPVPEIEIVEKNIAQPCEGLEPSQGLSEDDTIVLVIEDNADVRAYIRGHLEPDYKIIEAKDGAEGVDKAIETIPDLVISDVMMPKKDGYQVCQALKTDERTSHIPVILLTAKAAAEEKLAGLETGADAYVLKPFRPKELAVRVRKLIELRRKLRQRFSTATVIKPSEVNATSVDQAFLQRAVATIEAHLEDEKLSVEALAKKVHMSVSQINRKLKALIDQSAGQMIRSMRLQRAADLLAHNAGSVTEIAYRVGFYDQAHFSKHFKKQFGCSPSQYQKHR